jgi:RNA recognition motif-containing protein
MTESQLKDLFKPYGKVVSAMIMTDQYTRGSLNFGYVKMSKSSDGQAAMEMLDGKTVNDRFLIVKAAHSA